MSLHIIPADLPTLTGGERRILEKQGLEAPITFLMNIDTFEQQPLNQNDIQQRKLLYVGMTRASERLYIHAANYSGNSFASRLMKVAPLPI
ncbi:ATP-binding domain-containing protein [Ectobacillus funiculus]|uniref:ATP-binding domain-containing protein n=1 Tax=Ectobacillus funiculus TaxID=137993 RepID=UPI00397CE52F